MDGFEGNSGVIVVAATNRSDLRTGSVPLVGRFVGRRWLALDVSVIVSVHPAVSVHPWFLV